MGVRREIRTQKDPYQEGHFQVSQKSESDLTVLQLVLITSGGVA